MRQFNTNLAFVDLLFNMLVGFTCLFVIAFMLINPISNPEKIDPPVLMLVEMQWDNNSDSDIDLHMRGPDGAHVSFKYKDAAYMVLERDDIGKNTDTFELNGEIVSVLRNHEMISVTMLPAGEYVVNIYYYSSKGDPEDVTVSVKQISPYREILKTTTTLFPLGEKTVVSFYVDDYGQVSDIRTDIHIPLYGGAVAP